jgi:D-aminopeptidase
MKNIFLFTILVLGNLLIYAQKPRARDIGIPFEGTPGKIQRYNFTKLDELPNDLIDPLFEATIQATEEAIINAMVAAETMEGINGNKSYALPHKLVIDILKKYYRIK